MTANLTTRRLDEFREAETRVVHPVPAQAFPPARGLAGTVEARADAWNVHSRLSALTVMTALPSAPRHGQTPFTSPLRPGPAGADACRPSPDAPHGPWRSHPSVAASFSPVAHSFAALLRPVRHPRIPDGRAFASPLSLTLAVLAYHYCKGRASIMSQVADLSITSTEIRRYAPTKNSTARYYSHVSGSIVGRFGRKNHSAGQRIRKS